LRWLYPDEDIARMNTYGWRSALHHQSVFHHDKEVSWVKIEGEDLENAKELETLLSNDLSGENSQIDDMDPPSELVVWLCAHCLDLPNQAGPRELYDIKSHLHVVHDILEPQLDRDYYKDFEAPQGYRTDIINKMALVHLDMPRPTTSEELPTAS